MSESKNLRYGDHIYLYSTGDHPRTYLSARSILEENVFFLECPFLLQNSVHYENQSELVFTIYPKLNYQAFKNFTKLKPNDEPIKIELLKKRLHVENEQNEQLITKMMGETVTFGSVVQLYHVSSKTFIR